MHHLFASIFAKIKKTKSIFTRPKQLSEFNSNKNFVHAREGTPPPPLHILLFLFALGVLLKWDINRGQEQWAANKWMAFLYIDSSQPNAAKLLKLCGRPILYSIWAELLCPRQKWKGGFKNKRDVLISESINIPRHFLIYITLRICIKIFCICTFYHII